MNSQYSYDELNIAVYPSYGKEENFAMMCK